MINKKFENIWTKKEDQLILDNPDKTVKELTELIRTRSSEAIKKRRQKLRERVSKEIVHPVITDNSLEVDQELLDILEDTNEQIDIPDEEIDLSQIAKKAMSVLDSARVESKPKSKVLLRTVRDRQEK